MASQALNKGALWMQNVDYQASWDRALFDALFITEGVIEGFAVTPNGGLGIAVSAGRAVVQGDEVAGQGKYLIDEDAVITLTLASVGSSRTEYVYIAVNDTAVAGGRAGNNVTIETSTSAPPNSALLLATLTLPGGTATITSGMIADGRVVTGVVGTGTITDVQLADSSVGTSELQASAVTTAKIADGAVTTVKIDNDAVTNAKIGPGAVGTTELATGGVTTAKIADGAVTTDKIADDAVTNAKIGPGAVGTTELAADAVTNAKMADASVGNAELINGSITTDKLASGVITSSKLGADSVSGVNIVDNAINSEHYVDGSIDEEHLSDLLLQMTVVTSLPNGWTGSIRYGKIGNLGLFFLTMNGSNASSQTMFTLPVGFRPSFMSYAFLNSSAADSMWFDTGGEIKTLTGSTYNRGWGIYQIA